MPQYMALLYESPMDPGQISPDQITPDQITGDTDVTDQVQAGGKQRANHFATRASRVSALRNAIFSASSVGSEASQPRDQFACSTT